MFPNIHTHRYNRIKGQGYSIDSPVLFLSTVISLASSLLQTTSGSGDPEATHSRVTLLPSVWTMSELLRLSTILGGTRMRKWTRCQNIDEPCPDTCRGSVSKSDFMISHMMLATDWEWNNIGLDQSGDTCSGWNNISSSSDWIILQFEWIKVSGRVIVTEPFGSRPFPAPPLSHWIKQLIKPIRAGHHTLDTDSDQLTHNVEVAEPGLGPGGVDLTHVLALIAPLDVSDVKIPHAVSVMTHPDPRVPGDHVILNSEYGAPVIVDPGNLHTSCQGQK